MTALRNICAAALLLALAISSASTAATPYTPARGNAERAAIMDAIRRGTGSDTTFTVGYLKVVIDDDTRLAFAEVSPASESLTPFSGWLLLKRETGERWKVLWGVEKKGYENCKFISVAYRNAVALAERFETSMALFSPSFRATRLGLTARRTGDICKGRIVTDVNG